MIIWQKAFIFWVVKLLRHVKNAESIMHGNIIILIMKDAKNEVPRMWKADRLNLDILWWKSNQSQVWICFEFFWFQNVENFFWVSWIIEIKIMAFICIRALKYEKISFIHTNRIIMKDLYIDIILISWVTLITRFSIKIHSILRFFMNHEEKVFCF